MTGPLQTATGRRGAFGAAAAALAMPAVAREPTAVEHQVQRIHLAHLRHCDTVAAYSAAEGTPGEDSATAALDVAWEAWAAAVELLATMPATCPADVLLKTALVISGAESGMADAELLLADSLRHDLWRFAPGCRHLLPAGSRPGPANPPPVGG